MRVKLDSDRRRCEQPLSVDEYEYRLYSWRSCGRWERRREEEGEEARGAGGRPEAAGGTHPLLVLGQHRLQMLVIEKRRAEIVVRNLLSACPHLAHDELDW